MVLEPAEHFTRKMGRELIFATLKHETTGSIPWVPFAGVHAGKLKGYTAQEVLTDPDKLLDSLLAVNKRLHLE